MPGCATPPLLPNGVAHQEGDRGLHEGLLSVALQRFYDWEKRTCKVPLIKMSGAVLGLLLSHTM